MYGWQQGWVQATALLTCVVIWLFTGRQPVSGLMGVTPKYVLAGGVIGGLDHLHGDPQHGGSGAGPNFSSYRGGSDHRGLSDRAVWPVWSGKGPFAWNKLLGAAIAVGGIIIFQR